MMAAIYPLLLLAAALRAWRRRGDVGGQGWPWFLWWSLAGFVFSLSFVTGLSIGLFLLPFAAALLLWVAGRAPHARPAIGFLVGVAATAALVTVA